MKLLILIPYIFLLKYLINYYYYLDIFNIMNCYIFLISKLFLSIYSVFSPNHSINTNNKAHQYVEFDTCLMQNTYGPTNTKPCSALITSGTFKIN